MPLEVPSAEPCPFCQNVARERDDCAVIEDGGDTFAFVNMRQYEVGASLVIPKRHAPTIFDLDEIEAGRWMAHVHRIARAVLRAFEPDGVNVFQNNGVLAGQSVPHVHMHIVPRYPGGNGPVAFREGDYEQAALQTRLEIAARIRDALG